MFKDDKQNCKLCPSPTSLSGIGSIIFPLIMFIINRALLYLQFKSSNKGAIALADLECDRGSREVSASNDPEVQEAIHAKKMSMTLKSVITYFQILTIIEVEIPYLGQSVAGEPLGGLIIYPACFGSVLAEPLALRFYLNLAIPCLEVIAYMITAQIMYRKTNAGGYLSINAFIIVFSYHLPGVLQFLTALYCVGSLKAESGLEFLSLDASASCRTSTFDMILSIRSWAIFGLLLWCLFMMLIVIYISRGQMQRKHVLAFGYWFTEYKPGRYLWEFVRIFLKFSLILVNLSFGYDVKVKMIAVTAVLIFYHSILRSQQPYRNEEFNSLEMESCETNLANVFSILIVANLWWAIYFVFQSQGAKGINWQISIYFVCMCVAFCWAVYANVHFLYRNVTLLIKHYYSLSVDYAQTFHATIKETAQALFDSTFKPDINQQYTIVSAASGLAFYAPVDGSCMGSSIVQEKLINDDGSAFWFAPDEDSTFTIHHTSSGLLLDVKGADLSDGQGIILWESNSQPNQRFRIKAADRGIYFIEAQHSGKVLEAKGDDGEVGMMIIQAAFNGSERQRWRIILRQ